MKLKISIILLAATACITAQAQHINWHNEATDTVDINRLLKKAVMISVPQQRVASLAKDFIDLPYVAGTLEAEDERLTVNLDEVDCTTLIDNVVTLAVTAGEHRTSWRDFVYNLERLRYRGGEMKGYPSRLHYISDWIVDNTHRGNFEEVTNRCDLATYEIKTIDFMSANRSLYPALADSATFAKIKEAEIGYRSHRFPIIKTSRVAKAAKTFLRTGDIIALCTGKKGLDVSHMGILFINDKNIPYLLHASSKAGKVILDTTPLDRYLTTNRLTGIRVIRLKE
ncbi:MAG: DUF1460 domain-containing protein [Muribaculaceae bacterium]|nr:DUF1460 domain-containing protein [Muribaculaceae bacterium]